jgi:hypothetical protein
VTSTFKFDCVALASDWGDDGCRKDLPEDELYQVVQQGISADAEEQAKEKATKLNPTEADSIDWHWLEVGILF